MIRLLQKSKKFKKRNQLTAKSNVLVGCIIGTIIALTPYFFYLHESIPDGKVWSTFLFTYESKYYEDVNYLFWILTSKAIPLVLILIWFFTNRNWWYHALIVPIAMYTYQIIGLFNDDIKFIDQYQLIYLLPFMAIVIPSIYLLRAKMFDKIHSADKTMQELEEEFMFKPTTFWGKVKQYF